MFVLAVDEIVLIEVCLSIEDVGVIFRDDVVEIKGASFVKGSREPLPLPCHGGRCGGGGKEVVDIELEDEAPEKYNII